MPKLATAGRSFGRFRRAASAIRLACLIALVASLAPGGSVRAEDGCPAGRYPSPEGDGRCVPPADHNLLPVDDRKPMRFQMLEVARGAFLQGTGTITAETPAALRAFLTTKDAQFSKQLYLHSPGGSIEAAMELGEVIRGAGLNTNIGRTISIENETSSSELHTYKKAECTGACAYAFLGGVYRTYGGDLSRRSGIVELYGLKRGGGSKRPLSASETERLTSRLAAYLERMGVPQELLSVAASAPEGGVLSLPEEKAKALRVIVEPSRRTMFRVELWGGRPALRFNLPLYDMALEGLITCDQGPVLTVVDPSGKELPTFDGMRKFKALFRGADGRDIEGTVAYAPEGPEMPRPGLVFRIPGLASADLEGEGLTLNTIDLESAQAARAAGEDVGDVPVGIFDWMSLVDRIAFRVVGDNAARTAPLVLQSCGPAKTERAGAGPGPLDPRK